MKAARLVVLTVAIGAGGIAALLAGRTEKPPETPVAAAVKPDTVDILVARSDIPMGQTLSPGEIQWQAWPAGASTGNFIRKQDRPNAMEIVSGQIARVPFVAGEPIREQKLVNAKGSGFMAAILPPGMRAVSTLIRPETGAAGFILPNDRVDVILTRREGDNRGGGSGAPPSETILSNIRVLAIDQNIEEKNGQKVMAGTTATLELTQAQAELMAQGQAQGQISLSLRSITDASQQEAPEDTRRGGVNIVRFGVGTLATPR